jgi:adenylylsulfate kinase-like enzyme
MVQFDEHNLQKYLESRFGSSARILAVSVLGQESGAKELKGYGYGVPVKIEYELSGQRRAAVLETITPGPFGHEHMADRAQILLWSHAAFNRLHRHVRSLDVGGFSKDGTLQSVAGVEEFFIFDATANRRAYRAEARAAIDRFLEVYVECPLDVCVARDPKGIYRKARSGEASTVPGVQAAYEPPAPADVVVSGHSASPASAADTIVRALEDKGYLARQSVSTTP